MSFRFRNRQRAASLVAKCLSPLVLLMVCSGVAAAQSPPFVINGPSVALTPGCALALSGGIPKPLTTNCVGIAYPSDSTIATNRYILVPRGNLEFDFPVSSSIVKLLKGYQNLGIEITVVVTGPNDGETATVTGGASFPGQGQATVRIPVNVDWAESMVSFQIWAEEERCLPGYQKNGEPNCSEGDGEFTGPDLSAVNSGGNWIGSHWPSGVSGDSFVVVATPAASFQLPIVPTAIVYAPLGNGSRASSTFGITEIVGATQQFSNTNDQTNGLTDDDKTQLQAGVSFSLGPQKPSTNNNNNGNTGTGNTPPADNSVFCGMGTNCSVNLGFSYSKTWDNSTQDTTEHSYAVSKSVAFETQNAATFTTQPASGEPSLDKMTLTTEPFWSDVILGVTNAQYALWDYPAGPVIQALGGANVVSMQIRQLDACASAPQSIEPATFVPAQWAASTAFTAGTVLLDSNNQLQVATGSDGVSGGTQPSWSTVPGGSTLDGSITWTNQTSDFGIYRGSVPQDSEQYMQIGPWQANTIYPVGSVIAAPGYIQVATTGGVSGASAPAWNKTDEGSTADGTVTWTNEQEHFVVSAAAPALEISAFQWLTSEQCTDYLSLDQFYVNKSQSATPKAYVALGSQLSLTPNDPTTYSNQTKTTTIAGDTSLTKQSTTVTSVATNTLNISLTDNPAFAFVQSVLGISLSASFNNTQTTTMTFGNSDAQTLANSTTVTGQQMSATTIQDTGSEQSIPVNVLLDATFLGVAVQDTNLLPAPSTPALAGGLDAQNTLAASVDKLPVVAAGQSLTAFNQAGISAPTQYVQETNYGLKVIVNKPKPTPESEERVRAMRAEHAATHEQRAIPEPPAPSVTYR